MNLPLAEQMAIAVLKGDLGDARALADLLIQDWDGGAKEIPPASVDGSPEGSGPRTVHPPFNLYRINVPKDRLRFVVYFPLEDSNGNPIHVDIEATRLHIREWLEGSRQVLGVQGCERLDIYELPEWFVPPRTRIVRDEEPVSATRPPEPEGTEAYRRFRALLPQAFDPEWKGDEATYREVATKLRQLADEAKVWEVKERLIRTHQLPTNSSERGRILYQLLRTGGIDYNERDLVSYWIQELGRARREETEEGTGMGGDTHAEV